MSNGHGGGLPTIKTLWETLNYQQYSAWLSYALQFRNTHRRKKGGMPWTRKSGLNAWSAFVKVNGLLYSVGLPLLAAAPQGIYSPTLPSDMRVTFTPSQFNLTWDDPTETFGTAKLRVHIKPPPIPGVGIPGATIHSVLNMGVEALTITDFWYKSILRNLHNGIWRFWVDCVNEYGIVSGTSNAYILILRSIRMDAPNFDSGWVPIAPGATIVENHALGGDKDKYVVHMEFQSVGLLDHACGWGAYAIGPPPTKGAHWHTMDNANLSVTRGALDANITSYRIRMWVHP